MKNYAITGCCGTAQHNGMYELGDDAVPNVTAVGPSTPQEPRETSLWSSFVPNAILFVPGAVIGGLFGGIVEKRPFAGALIGAGVNYLFLKYYLGWSEDVIRSYTGN